MCVELGRLAGYQDVTVTTTIQFMTLEEIREIPNDCTITYATIVVDYWVQKKDLNTVCIMVGKKQFRTPFQLSVLIMIMLMLMLMYSV